MTTKNIIVILLLVMAIFYLPLIGFCAEGDNALKPVDPGKRFASEYGFSTSETPANNDTYFHQAVAAMSAGEMLIIPEGTSKINNAIFNPPSGCSLKCYGILSSNASGTAFTIGNATGTTKAEYYDIKDLQVNSQSIDRSADRIGILVRNIYNSKIDIRSCQGFETGVRVDGNGTGCVYNDFTFGKIFNNKYSLHLTASDSGWTNQNSFSQGNFGWQSGTDTTDFRHIWIDHYATHRINGNSFHSPALENSGSVVTDTTVGIYNEGWYNNFYAPRFEMGDNATIINCTSNSRFNDYMFGYALIDMTTRNVTDNGLDNNFFCHDLLYLTADIRTSGSVNSTSFIGSGAALTGLQAPDMADGSVTDVEFQYINSLDNNAQTQITARASHAGQVYTGNHDFGGADFEFPQASPGAPDADGEAELDFTDGSLVVQHGSAHAELGAATDVVMGKLIKSFAAILAFPDLLQAEIDNWPLKAIESSEFPHGIILTDIYLKTSASSTYAVNVENWDDPTTINVANGTIDAITTSSSTEVHEDTITYATIVAGQIIMLDLPTTDIGWACIQCEYYEPIA